MSTDLTVNPLTGEAVELASAADTELARWLDEIKEYESRLRELKSLVGAEVLARMDLDGEFTRRAGDWKMSAPSPAPKEEFDAVALLDDLEDLLEEGLISKKLVQRTVRPTVEYRVSQAGVKALRSLGGKVAETVEKHCELTERKRYVKVERER